MFCVDTAPSGPTQAQRLATQIDDEVIAMPNAPVLLAAGGDGVGHGASLRLVFLVLDSTR